MKWAHSTSCNRLRDGRLEIRHAVGFCEAANRYEAIGKALATSRHVYPPVEGWKDHNAVVADVNEPAVEPEDAHLEQRD